MPTGASTSSPAPATSQLVEEPGQGMVLVVPPNPVDVAIMRGHIVGCFVCFLGIAVAGPFGLPLRFLFAVSGLLVGYFLGGATVQNPVASLRFVFKPEQRKVIVTKLSGKTLESDPIDTTHIQLLRKSKTGPGRFEWRSGSDFLAIDLCEQDFEALKGYGVPFVPKGAPTPVSTTFTRAQKKELGIWAAIWSGPWWIAIGQLLFSGR